MIHRGLMNILRAVETKHYVMEQVGLSQPLEKEYNLERLILFFK